MARPKSAKTPKPKSASKPTPKSQESPGPSTEEGPGISLSAADLEAVLAELAFTQEQRDGWEERAADFEKDGIQLWEYINRRLLVHLQILDHVATNPQPTRTGMQVALAAAKDFQSVADMVLENSEQMLRQKRAGEKSKKE